MSYTVMLENKLKKTINSSVLLGDGKATNFQFEIVGRKLTTEQVEVINNISGRSKIKERVKAIINSSCMLNFVRLENKTFANNLALIDSALPQIIAIMVLKFYTGGLSKTSDLLATLNEDNALDFDTSDNHPFYSYKIKRLLTDIAVGMTPAKVWDGVYDATGGYLIVRKDGDIVCYHLYEKNSFENYLLDNTKFETASSTRYGFGKIYSEAGKLYINLNLQIRFIK